jgi:hypothetical protein
MSSVNIRDRLMNSGLSGLDTMATQLAAEIDSTDTNNQTEYLKLQQKIASYTNTVSLMTNILKNLSDTDKAVINNS